MGSIEYWSAVKKRRGEGIIFKARRRRQTRGLEALLGEINLVDDQLEAIG